jgi:hypothetical protein
MADLRGVSLFNLGVMLCGLSVYSGICFFGGEPLRVPPSEVVIVGMSIGAEGAAVYAALIATAALSVGFPLVVGAALLYIGHKRIRSWKEQLPLERGRYRRATRRWERLYYCPRDHGVFTPGDTHLVPIAKMPELLYG